MTEAEGVAQAHLQIVVGVLEMIRDRLQGIAEALPSSRQELQKADFKDEPDITSEVRRVIQCVLTDNLGPAIRDLHAASIYKPTFAQAGTSGKEPLPPRHASDGGGPGVDLAERDILSDALEEDVRPLPCPD